MIVLIRCNDIISDSRTKKYIDFYEKNGIDYKIIAWDRLGNSERLPNAIYCPTKSKYNQGGFAAVKDRLKWMRFIKNTLFSFKEDLQIHACDLDAAFPAALYKMFSRRKNYLLFDVFDWISDTLYNQGKIISLAFKLMEKFSTKRTDHIIICEPERVKQIPYNIEGRYSVLQNIPSFDTSDFLHDDKRYHFSNNLLTLSYVGSFTQDRCIMELINGAAKGIYNLNIAGYGDKEITEKLEQQKESPYIRFYGKVTYTEGLNIMYNSDIIYAMYSKRNPNHLYAAPNKYYEAMFVGKPIITTDGIIVAEKVMSNNMGYSIEESSEALINLMRYVTIEQVKEKSANSSALWAKYEHATEDYLNMVYAKKMGINLSNNHNKEGLQ